jgi:[ribosomal protein S5]-alanine N-acetyltransferase
MEWKSELPTLRGKRVHLRHLQEADSANLFAVFGDPEVMVYWSSAAWPDLQTAIEYIRSIQSEFAEKQLFQWGVCAAESNEIVGTCTLCSYNPEQLRAEVGIILGKKSWGLGLGTEALNLLIQFAFDEMGLERLEADVDPNNERSLALFDGRGFVREGLQRERWRVHGEVQDSVVLGLLKREWLRPDAL